VAVLKRTVKSGTELRNGSVHVTAAKNIPAGHKIALAPISDGSPVRRYGQIIGFAQGNIAAGEHVHTHNVVVKDFARDYTAGTSIHPLEPAREARAFQGYARPDGKVGTRNYVAIISTVNCSASVSRYIKERFRRHRADAQGRLRHSRRRAAETSGARHGRHGASPEHFRVCPDRSRLRNEPGRPAAPELFAR
jgi:altronate hydrolase